MSSLLVHSLIAFVSVMSAVSGYSKSCSQSSPCSSISCPSSQTCTVTCTGGGCNGITINCPSTSNQCSVSCNGGSGGRACDGITIVATSASSLVITTGGIGDTMASSTIYCPQYGNCDVECSYSRACYGAGIHAAAGSTLTVQSLTDNAFETGTIYCGDNAECTLTCSGHSSCRSATIDAQNNNNAVIELDTYGHYNAFYDGKIYGSTSGIITADCQGQESCRSAEFVGTNSGALIITGSGFGVLMSSTIRCPDNGADKTIACNIIISGSSSNCLKNAFIYAAESFRDIDIYCADGGSSCDNPNDLNGLTMKCTASYSSECSMQVSAYDNWSCTSGSATCQYFEYTPTPPPSTPKPTPKHGRCFIGNSCGQTEDCCTHDYERSIGISCQYDKCCILSGKSGCETADDCCKTNGVCHEGTCYSKSQHKKILNNRRLIMRYNQTNKTKPIKFK
eukprot:746778_1